jgi:hypothetical protein
VYRTKVLSRFAHARRSPGSYHARMIQHMHHRCLGCRGRATRQVFIEGAWDWLCDTCPSPEEIREQADVIRARWPESRRTEAYSNERHGTVRLDAHVFHFVDAGE